MRNRKPEVRQSTPAQPVALPTHAQIASLLEAAAYSQTATALRDRALLEVLWDTGMQASELVELNLADVDLVQNTLVCGAGSRRQRTLKLGQRAARALADYLAQERERPHNGDADSAQGSQPLFRNHRGQRLTRQGVWVIVRAYAAASGLDGQITPRSLRRSVAARLRQSGVGARQARKQLGVNRLTADRQNNDGQTREETIPRLLLDGRIAIP